METQNVDRWSGRLSAVGLVVLLLVFAELLVFLLVGNQTALIVVEVLLLGALVAHWRLQVRAFSGQVRKRYFLYVFPITGRVLAFLLLSFVGPVGVVLSMGLFVGADALLLTGLIKMASELTKDLKTG